MQRQHDNDHLAMLAEFMTAMEQPSAKVGKTSKAASLA